LFKYGLSSGDEGSTGFNLGLCMEPAKEWYYSIKTLEIKKSFLLEQFWKLCRNA